MFEKPDHSGMLERVRTKGRRRQACRIGRVHATSPAIKAAPSEPPTAVSLPVDAAVREALVSPVDAEATLCSAAGDDLLSERLADASNGMVWVELMPSRLSGEGQGPSSRL